MEKGDRDRLDPVQDPRLLQRGDHLLQAGQVQRLVDLAEPVEPLVDLEAERPRHQVSHLGRVEIVDVVPHLALGVQDVAEAPRGDEGGDGALALDQGIGDEGGAMNGRVDLAAGAPVAARSVCQPSMTACAG